MKLLNKIVTVALVATTAFAELKNVPDDVDMNQLNAAMADALNSLQPGTPQQQQEATKDMKIKYIEGPLECDDEEKIEPQKYVSFEYVGTIAEESETGTPGELFDSSSLPGRAPLDFQHSLGQVPRGLDFATNGLCQGVNVTITIPPLLAFGDEGNGGSIPGGATIEFNILVKKVSKEDFRPPYNFFENMDSDRDGRVSRKEMTEFMLVYYRAGVPDELWNAADKNGDGYSDWDEFIFDKGEKKKVINLDEEDRKAAQKKAQKEADDSLKKEDDVDDASKEEYEEKFEIKTARE